MRKSSLHTSVRRRRSGVILIVCLWLLAAMSMLALGLAYRLRLETRIVSFRLRNGQMREFARAALALAASRVEKAEPACTFYGQTWAAPVRLSQADFGDLEVENVGRFSIQAMVCDEAAKLNVNSAVRSQLLCLPFTDDEIISAVIDWRDEDDALSSMGAETAFYRSLTPPRMAKNKPLDSVYELLLVRGIDPALFFGADGDTVRVPDGTPEYRPPAPGLRDYLTVAGDGRININTAGYFVLLAIPGVTEEMADNIIYVRSGPDGVERTPDDAPFRSFDQLKNVGGITDFALKQIAVNCVLTSNFFNVRVEVAQASSYALHIDAVYERTDKGARCVSWRER